MALLIIPEWFYTGILSAAGAVIIGFSGVIWWFIRRNIRTIDRNTSAIESLDITMVKMSGNFEKYQATTDGKLDRIEELARIASRDVKVQEGDLAEIRTDIVKLDGRVKILEKDHDFYHKKK